MGGTYADFWNEQQARRSPSGAGAGGAGGGRRSGAPSGPVRLTISRGDYVFDAATNELQYEEEWEQEELMEADVTDPDADADLNAGDLWGADEPESATDGPRSPRRAGGVAGEVSAAASDVGQHLDGLKRLGKRGGFSLMLLDTNVLISHQSFLKHVFSLLLNKNIAYLTSQSDDISPFALVVPKTVLRELDGLKKGGYRRRSTSANGSSKGGGGGSYGAVERVAQEANVWILQALRAQKQWNLNGARLPEPLWALHVQTQEHLGIHEARAMSNDEQIVALGRKLQRETGLTAVLCSNDVNARLVAEAEGLATLELRSILEPIKVGDDKELAQVAKDILEQWCAQHRPAALHGADAQADAEHSDELHAQPDMDLDEDMRPHTPEPAPQPVPAPAAAPAAPPPRTPPPSSPRAAMRDGEVGSIGSRWAVRADGLPVRPMRSPPAGSPVRARSYGSASASASPHAGLGLSPPAEPVPPRRRSEWDHGNG